jgi:hypothetical protein
VGRLPAVLAALAALALSGCGGCGSGGTHPKTVPASTLVSAARTTATAGSFTFTIGGTFDALGRSFPIHGAGAVDARARRARASLDLSQALAQTGIQTITPAEARAEAVAAGSTVWVHSPYLAKRRGARRPWLRFDSVAIRPLAYLAAVGVVNRLGTERVDGVSTTHYATEIDLRRYARTAKPSEMAALSYLMRLAGNSIPADVWVDAAGRIRRVQLQITTISFQAKPRIDIDGFGRPVAIRTPSPAQVSPAR